MPSPIAKAINQAKLIGRPKKARGLPPSLRKLTPEQLTKQAARVEKESHRKRVKARKDAERLAFLLNNNASTASPTPPKKNTKHKPGISPDARLQKLPPKG